MRRAQGFTLIELLIAVTIMLLCVAMAGSVIMAGVTVAHNSDSLMEQLDDARVGLGLIARDVSLAGNGAPNGLYVDFPSSSSTLISPIFGLDGTSGAGVPVGGTASAINPTSDHRWETDDLWLVVPDKNAMGESCIASGANTTITKASAGGPVAVRCTASFAVGDLLLATNMTTGALLTVSTLTAPASTTVPGSIAFTEQSAGSYSDAPDHGGFQQGDMVYRVKLVHYYVRNDPNGTPALYRSEGGSVLGTAVSTSGYPSSPYPLAGRPFVDTDQGTVVQEYVDDMQVAYGYDTSLSGNPSNYTWTNGLAPNFRDTSGATRNPGPAQLRAVRVTLVVRGRQHLLNNKNSTVYTSDTQPPVVENHYATSGAQPAADGYRRVAYTRTIELPNVAPGSL